MSEQGQDPSSHTVALCSCIPFPLSPAVPVSRNRQQIQEHLLGNSTGALCPERENKVLGPLYLGLQSQEEEAPRLLLRHPFGPISYPVSCLDLRKDR